jgi:hypothetical protein
MRATFVNKSLICSGVVLLMLGQFCWASLFEDLVNTTGDVSETAEHKSPLSLLRYELNGKIKGGMVIGTFTDNLPAATKNAFAEIELRLQAKAGDQGSGFASMILRQDEVDDPADDWLLREAYVDLFCGNLDIRWGKQIIVWGRADGINPTNHCTPMDYSLRSSNTDQQRLGNTGIRAYYYLRPFRLEGIWMPVYKPSQLPMFEMDQGIHLTQTRTPEKTLQNGLFAGKVNWEIPAWETSLSYLRSYALIPGFAFQGMSMTTAGLMIVVEPRPYQVDISGFDFSTTIGRWGLRGEAAYRVPISDSREEYIPNSDVQWVIGIDRDMFRQLNIILQYAGTYVLEWDEIESRSQATVFMDPVTFAKHQLAGQTELIASQTHELQHALSLRLAWTFWHETLTVEVLGLYNWTAKSWICRPQVDYEVADALHIIAGGDIYGGPESTLYGRIAGTRNAGYVEIVMDF